ncbi:MAG: hypothetical protein H8E15_01260 [Planctomycetes bacterium]|nr:hypothetical protein [Planctomycetota bacterium]
MKRIFAPLILIMASLSSCQSSPQTQSFDIQPGARVITVHANMILEIPDSNGVIEEVQCYKIAHNYKIQIDFWLEQNGMQLERSITVPARRNNTAQDIAGEIARRMNAATGTSLVRSEETSLPNFSGSKSGRYSTQDVVFTEFIRLTSMKIEKTELEWSEDYPGRSYLQIFVNR